MLRAPHLGIVTLALSLLLTTGPLSAQTDFPSQTELDAQIRRVRLALDRIQIEQQSVYQQFQMMQEMRRTELQESYGSALVYTPPPTPPDYEEEVRQREEREARARAYTAELDRLYARYRELEEQKRPLLEELSELALQRR
jgi:Mg-chelatase subunit ChlI